MENESKDSGEAIHSNGIELTKPMDINNTENKPMENNVEPNKCVENNDIESKQPGEAKSNAEESTVSSNNLEEASKSKDEEYDSSSNVEMKSQSDNESNSTLTHNIEEKIQLNSTPHVISDMDSSSLNSSICPSKSYARSDSSTDCDKKNKDFIPPMNVDIKSPPSGTAADKNGGVVTNGVNDENAAGPSNCNNGNAGGGSGTRKRPKCKYGKQCYRKNPQHKIEFCHKGDAEYETSSSEESSENEKPPCMYGSTCFRKNIEHRKKYSHRAPAVTRKRKKPTKGTKSPTTDSPTTSKHKKRKVVLDKQAAGGGKDVNMTSDEDSYDYEDPFLNDDATEDEFVPTSSLTESSELSDAEAEVNMSEPDESSNRRLIKEAKRFMKDKT